VSPADRLRALAALAATGVAPSVSALAVDAADALRWRVAVSRLRAVGLLAWPTAAAVAGRPAPLWPGPRAGEVLEAAELEAWERCRDLPSPDGGWVEVEGEVLRAVDGVALAREVGVEDVRLLRGGVAVGVVSGRCCRWGVVDVV
jgi:hypothetical protein